MNEEKSSFIKGINEQHPAAYHQLYNEYYKALVLYAINFLSSQQAAEDIVQDVGKENEILIIAFFPNLSL